MSFDLKHPFQSRGRMVRRVGFKKLTTVKLAKVQNRQAWTIRRLGRNLSHDEIGWILLVELTELTKAEVEMLHQVDASAIIRALSINIDRFNQ
ncbi:hypothetical protein [Cucumibacter marinus]|uniref:hypothetical protein n=1 Tax=Cucumibacter marinus TaxID=1121252 RepID=UPI000407DA6D|nr:hypothetical protein [Cucumibacter marinus]